MSSSTITMILGSSRVVVTLGEEVTISPPVQKGEYFITFPSPDPLTLRRLIVAYTIVFALGAVIVSVMAAAAVTSLRFSFENGCFFKVGNGRLYLFGFVAFVAALILAFVSLTVLARSVQAYRKMFIKWHIKRNIGRLLMTLVAAGLLILSSALQSNSIMFPSIYFACLVVGNLVIAASDSMLLVFPPNLAVSLAYKTMLLSSILMLLSSRVYLFAAPNKSCNLSGGRRSVGIALLQILTEAANSILLMGLAKAFLTKARDIQRPMVELDRSALWSLKLVEKKPESEFVRV